MDIQFLDAVYGLPNGEQKIERQIVVLLDEDDVQHLQAGKLGTLPVSAADLVNATEIVVTTEAALTRAINHLRTQGTRVIDQNAPESAPADEPEAEGPASVLVFPSQTVEA